MEKICIYSEDVVKITEQGTRKAQKLLRALRLAYKKKKRHYVTITEFSKYTDISEEIIRKRLGR